MATLSMTRLSRKELLARWLMAEVYGEEQAVIVAVAWVAVRAGLVSTSPAVVVPTTEIQSIAAEVLAGTGRCPSPIAVPDPTDGANAYYPVWMMPPVWERQAQFKIQIGNYRFYYLD